MLTESSLVERKKAAKTISRGGPNKATPPRTKNYYALTKKILTILAIAMILNYLRIHSKSRNSNMKQKDQKVGALDSSITTHSSDKVLKIVDWKDASTQEEEDTVSCQFTKFTS